ncbi:MAG: hypothetical protein K8I27_13670 [Planctomycetes bacterium]|nr:hypothetical protein [Planctomycetota bacterium]
MSKKPRPLHHERLIVAWALWKSAEGDQPPFALDDFIDDVATASEWFVYEPFALVVWNRVLRMAGFQTTCGPAMDILVGDLSRLVIAYDVHSWSLRTIREALSVADKFIWANYSPAPQALAGATPRRTTKDSISTLAEAVAEAGEYNHAVVARYRHRLVRDLLGV